MVHWMSTSTDSAIMILLPVLGRNLHQVSGWCLDVVAQFREARPGKDNALMGVDARGEAGSVDIHTRSGLAKITGTWAHKCIPVFLLRVFRVYNSRLKIADMSCQDRINAIGNRGRPRTAC